jgi:two-component sensor histidine kinase
MILFKKLFILTILLFSIVSAIGQTRPDALYLKLSKSNIDTNRINIMEDLGRYYRRLNDTRIEDIDTCIVFFKQALQLSQQLHNKDKEMKAQSLLSGAYFYKGDVQSARTLGLEVIEYYRQHKDLKNQAEYTDQFAYDMKPKTPEDIIEKIRWYEESARLNGLIHNQVAQINTARKIAELHVDQGKLDLAEHELLEVINRYHTIGYNKLRYTYDLLATISATRGDLKKQLEYQLKLVDNMQASGDTLYADRYYRRLADNYYEAGMFDEALKWGNRGMQVAIRNKDNVYLYSVLDLLVLVKVRQYKGSEALALVQETIKNIKPVTLNQKLAVFTTLAYCYESLKQIAKAEKNYLSADSIFDIQNDEKKFGARTKNYNTMLIHEMSLSNFYYRYRKFDKARFFLNKAFVLPQGTIKPNYIGTLYMIQYKIDSVTGDYQSALKHLVRYKTINDSIFNATKSKQLADLHVKYETDKKEQAIRVLQAQEKQAVLERNMKQADLDKVSLQRDLQKGELQKADLQHNADLQKAGLERNIQRAELQKIAVQRKSELEKANFERNIQQDELQRVNTQRNITFGGIAALLVISGLAYNGYRNKMRSNRKLEIKQIEINDQNASLQNLVTEKEWLLKEVHHRVKNNLQIVMSLLSSQSAYLENTAAIEAIKESQNRVQAIALIHQKLYKSNNVASINMPAYIADLLEYLADSFDTRKRHIVFEQLIEPISLDLAQTVPLGLILNEAVTNAIKYAFNDHGGQIIVALQLINHETLLLTIADNGRGFPANKSLTDTNSLGMEMMKALSKQLGGEFIIENKGGIRISIEFFIEQLVPELSKI